VSDKIASRYFYKDKLFVKIGNSRRFCHNVTSIVVTILLIFVQDLEDALMISGGQEESRFLADLHARLLRGLFSKKAEIKYVYISTVY
jgi:hypothetical protein